jgi:hypothetical protein
MITPNRGTLKSWVLVLTGLVFFLVCLVCSVHCGSTVAVTAPVRVYNCSQAPGTVQDSELHCVEVREDSSDKPADAGQGLPQAVSGLVLRVKG